MAFIVFTGGARSGKSALAQELACSRALDGARVVVVVFGSASQDSEMAERIEHHRADRPKSFHVIEAVDSLSWIDELADGDVVVVDCLGTLATRILDEELVSGRYPGAADAPDVPGAEDGPESGVTLPAGLASAVEERLDGVVDALRTRSGDAIVVTNEVGDGVVPAYPSGRLFRDVLGRANRRLVQTADAAYLVVCGRAVDLSALPTAVRWPSD